MEVVIVSPCLPGRNANSPGSRRRSSSARHWPIASRTSSTSISTCCSSGSNPGRYSAAIRHHFGHPGNRFWPSVCAGGLTDGVELTAFDDWRLPEFGLGITNLCPRASTRADELSGEELRRGVRTLKRKIARYRPRFVAFLGITSFRTAFGVRAGQVGRQDMTLGGAAVWVLPNPSGLNAHFLLPDLARLFGELKTALDRRTITRKK